MDADLDTLTDVMGDALLSLYRSGQINETKLTNYAVAKTLRHISQRGPAIGVSHAGPHDRRHNPDPLPSAEKRLVPRTSLSGHSPQSAFLFQKLRQLCNVRRYPSGFVLRQPAHLKSSRWV